MRKRINSFIQNLKGEDYHLDERIPTGYLVGLLWSRMIMAARGGLSRVKHNGYLFIGPGVMIKAKSRFRTGKNTSIAKGCFIDALSTDGLEFGDNVSLGKYVRIECTGNLQDIGKGMKVGNNVGLGADNFFGCAGGIHIGDDTILGNMISFHAENHVYEVSDLPIRLQGFTRLGIRVGRNCWIGAKATILDGAVIEDGCIIAAGAVVTGGSYKANGIYGGVPAKLIKYREDISKISNTEKTYLA
jgi:acetyltransferase-like isoleucine patch superfamily enzyme